MTPYAFGRKLAFELPKPQPASAGPALPAPHSQAAWKMNLGRSQPSAPTNWAVPKSPVPKSPLAPSNLAQTMGNMPSAKTMLGNMTSNGARFGGGMLGMLGGGLSTVPTGIAAGATNAWNAMTPSSMNTSQQFSQGVNDVFQKSVDFTNAGARDMVGSMGGDMDYGNNQAWNQMEQGLNSMPQNTTTDRVLSGVANTGAYGGATAWNMAQAVANPGKILGNLPRAGLNPRTWFAAGSRIMPKATGGVVNTSTAGRALPQLARAGTGVNTADNYNNLFLQIPNLGMQMLPGEQPPNTYTPDTNTYASFSQ